MGPLDALWHVLNFFVPALGLGLLGSAAVKLLWRHELKGVAWRRLAFWTVGAGAMTLLAGLVFLGRDGRMTTYGALIVVSAAVLWWIGFGPGRR